MKEEKKNQCNDACEEQECTCNDDHCREGACNCEHPHEELDKKHKKDKHKEELKKLKEQNTQLEDALLRSKAEFINYRKRLEEEQSRLLKYANEDLVLETLPTLDNFERAIVMDNDNLEDEVSKFLSGIKMIYCNLLSTLEKYGVKAIDGNHKPFDPNYHQAVMTEKIEDMEPGMVIEVLQKGYLLKDKVIRPAMVRVSE